LCALIGVCLLASVGIAQSKGSSLAGAEAPEGQWYTRAGCASRSGRTRTSAPRSAPPLAWTRQFPAALEGEPLVWEERVLIETKPVLYGLDRRSGAVLFERAAPAQPDFRFQPTLYGPALVWRGAGNTLECWRWQGRTALPTLTLNFATPPRSWLLFEEELYVLVDDALQCYAFGDLQPRWSTQGIFMGELALLGDALYVSGHDKQRSAFLNVLERSTGALRKSFLAGYYGELTPHPNAYPTLCASRANVYVRHTVPLSTKTGQVSWSDVDTDQGQEPRMLAFLTSPALTGDGWIAFVNEVTSRRRALVRFIEDKDGFQELAAKDHHAEFAQSLVPASIAGSVACLGSGAFDVESQRALWRLNGTVTQRTVPVRDGVLIVPEPQELRAYLAAAAVPKADAPPALAAFPFASPTPSATAPGTTAPRTTAPGTTAPGTTAPGSTAPGTTAPGTTAPGTAARGTAAPGATPPAAAPANAEKPDPRGALLAKATACFADGVLVDGDLRCKFESGKVWSAALKKSMPLAELQYAEDPDGKPYFLRRASDALAFATAIHERRAAKQYVELAAKAATANGAALGRECLRRARRLGASGKELDALDKKLAGIGAKKPVAKTLEELETKVRELDSSRLTQLVSRWQALSTNASIEDQLPWLREILALDPAQPAATAVVRAALPDGLAPGAEFDARAWLEFARSRPRETLKTIQVVPGAKPEVDTPPWGLALARSIAPENRRRWRADVQAVGDDNLYILSPMTDPEALRACWSTSALVSRCLESMFGGVRGGALAARPLELRLYESKSEYMSHGFERAGEASRGLLWTAGHYDPLANITHVYFPERVPHEAVSPVFAHEVVHHWIQARCPRIEDSAAILRALDKDGYWIVEGFANMVEEFDWDLDAGTWSSPSRHADSPSIVARVDSDALWPWPKIAELSKVEFNGLKVREVAQLTAPNWLGRSSSLSNISLYYAQAGTLASYLYHADGARLRPRLFEYLTAFYEARTDGTSFEQIFGATAATLGEKATQWARELTEETDSGAK
jgi:hypothetical protein